MSLAPDDRLRRHRSAKSMAEQEARERRDLALLQIDKKYLPKIKKATEERKRLMVETYNCWRTKREEINREFSEEEK